MEKHESYMAEIHCGFFALEDVSADASVGIVLPIFLPLSLCLPSPAVSMGPLGANQHGGF